MPDGDSEEVLLTRKLALQAQEFFTKAVETLPEDQAETIREWLSAYGLLEDLRNHTLPECQEGWARNTQACGTCGTLNRWNFFRDSYSERDGDFFISLVVRYLGGFPKHLSYSWRASVTHQAVPSAQASMSGFATTYDHACLLAERTAEDLTKAAKAQVELAEQLS